MVSVGILKLSITDLFFVDPDYYHNRLLSQQLLPMMCNVSDNFLIFQQDSAPTHLTHCR